MEIDLKKLEIAMASKVVTSKRLSEVSGLSETTLARIKNGIQKPKPITIGKIAKALEVEILEITK